MDTQPPMLPHRRRLRGRTLGALALSGGVALAHGCKAPPAPSEGEELTAAGAEATAVAALAAEATWTRSHHTGDPSPPVKEALGALKRQLTGALKGAMERGGPIEAVGFCSDRAAAIAAGLQRPGLRIGRTSHRLRNPANAAPAWAAAAVAEAPTKRLDTVPAQQHFDLGGGKTGYLEIIATIPMCTACHGAVDAMAPEVRTVLQQRYPADQATGFAAGDIRGWFWAEIDGDAGGATP